MWELEGEACESFILNHVNTKKKMLQRTVSATKSWVGWIDITCVINTHRICPRVCLGKLWIKPWKYRNYASNRSKIFYLWGQQSHNWQCVLKTNLAKLVYKVFLLPLRALVAAFQKWDVYLVLDIKNHIQLSEPWLGLVGCPLFVPWLGPPGLRGILLGLKL